MLRFENVEKSFAKLRVLQGVDLTIAHGGIFAILGPNGSGKTTLIKCALGMVLPDSGSIAIDGKEIKGQWSYRNDINYLPQIATFPGNLRVHEVIKLVDGLREKESRADDLVATFGLEPFLNKKLSTLSGGTKQKVNIVLTFMFDSPLVILDEPTTGLDPVALIALKELVAQEKANGKTILVTTHIMSLVEEIADEIVFLLDGKIYFQGTVDALKESTSQDNLEHAIAAILTNAC